MACGWDSFLTPILAAARWYDGSELLRRNVLARAGQSDGELIAQVTSGSDSLSWLNRLEQGSLRQHIRSMLEELFGARIPAGWVEWGFKEILYGLNNDTPQMLLDIFSDSKAVFSFREPKSTIESMLMTWNPKLFDKPFDFEIIRKTYEERARRWITIMKYFLAMKGNLDSRVVFVCSELIDAGEEVVLNAINLPRRRDALAAMPVGRTNTGPRPPESAASELVGSLFDDIRGEFRDIYDRAYETSQRDLMLHERVGSSANA